MEFKHQTVIERLENISILRKAWSESLELEKNRIWMAGWGMGAWIGRHYQFSRQGGSLGNILCLQVIKFYVLGKLH